MQRTEKVALDQGDTVPASNVQNLVISSLLYYRRKVSNLMINVKNTQVNPLFIV